MLAMAKSSGEPASSSLEATNQVWKGVWKIQASNRVRHFIWRAVKDSLPTKENLKKRQIQLDVTCSLCDESKEDTMHTLWLCDQAQSVWKSEASFVYLYQRKFRTFMDLFEVVLDRGSVFKVAWFSTIAWSLWQRRNRIRERQQTWPLHEVSRRAKEMVLEFFEINRRPTQPVRRSAPTYWHPP